MAKLHKFIVSARSGLQFPTDMLRYDCCWPAGPGDAEKLCDQVAMNNQKEPQTIRIVMLSIGPPTAARWFSFGWHVDLDGRV
jgi:hypothetical protein